MWCHCCGVGAEAVKVQARVRAKRGGQEAVLPHSVFVPKLLPF